MILSLNKVNNIQDLLIILNISQNFNVHIENRRKHEAITVLNHRNTKVILYWNANSFPTLSNCMGMLAW